MSTVHERCELLHRIAGVTTNDGIAFAELVEEVPAAEMPVSTNLLGLMELILKRPDRLERLIREPSRQADLLPRFLAIALVGFVFFGVALSLVFTAAGQWPRLTPIRDLVAGETMTVAVFESQSAYSSWLEGSAWQLIAAYAIGLVAASGICLPSLYFYSLLAGIRMTMLDVVLQTLKSKATAAVALVGILPIYSALALGILIFDVPQIVREVTFGLGLVLPFLAGLFGTYSLYRSLGSFADTLPLDRRGRRECFLQRLVVSWAACYTAVTPVMIHSLWVMLATWQDSKFQLILQGEMSWDCCSD
jgi:hypothetical protein